MEEIRQKEDERMEEIRQKEREVRLEEERKILKEKRTNPSEYWEYLARLSENRRNG